MPGRNRVLPPITEELLQRLVEVERRSFWDIGLGIGVAASLVTMLVSTILEVREFEFNLTSPAPAFFAALALLLLLAWLILDRTRRVYVSHLKNFLELFRGRENLELALRDPLTGAYNRNALEDFADRCLRQAERTSSPLTLVVFDLNDFHWLNKKHGHLAGDLALTQFVRILEKAVRGSDFLARFGGDEFILLLPDTTVLAAQTVLDRVRQQVDSRNGGLSEGEVPLAFTYGCAQMRHGARFAELFSEADNDMLARKDRRSGTAGATRT